MPDVYVTAVGEFGQQVADRLVRRYDTYVAHPVEIPDTSRWARARIHLVAAWREAPSLFDKADRMAFVTGRPWLPITLDATSGRVGPFVSGRRGPCYRCFQARQYQHGRLREMDRELFRRYDSDPTIGVGGHLGAHVCLAVAAAARCIDAVLAGDADKEFGRLRRFGLLTPQWSTDTVLAVHGCDRCGRAGPDSTWADLSRDMRLLTGEPGDRRRVPSSVNGAGG